MPVEFDQHFLNNPELLDLIVREAKIIEDDIVVEVGCGPGYLTDKLVKSKANKIIGLEIDANFEEILRDIEDVHSNFQIEIANALDKIDIITFNKLVANIPYSITEPLYEKLLELKPQRAVILQGKKFYDLCQSKESLWHYYVNAFYNVNLVEEVDGKEFEPKTKVKSVILSLTLKEKLTKKEKFFQELFEKRKRAAKNAIIFALVDSLELSKREAKEKIKNMQIPNEKLFLLSNKDLISIIEDLLIYLQD